MGIKNVIRFITKKENVPFKKIPLGHKILVMVNSLLIIITSLIVIFVGVYMFIESSELPHSKLWGIKEE